MKTIQRFDNQEFISLADFEQYVANKSGKNCVNTEMLHTLCAEIDARHQLQKKCNEEIVKGTTLSEDDNRNIQLTILAAGFPEPQDIFTLQCGRYRYLVQTYDNSNRTDLCRPRPVDAVFNLRWLLQDTTDKDIYPVAHTQIAPCGIDLQWDTYMLVVPYCLIHEYLMKLTEERIAAMEKNKDLSLREICQKFPPATKE